MLTLSCQKTEIKATIGNRGFLMYKKYGLCEKNWVYLRKRGFIMKNRIYHENRVY